MMFRHAVSCGFILAALALTGCDEGRTRPPQTSARVVNVAPGFAEVQFRRERVSPELLAFKTVQNFTWDVDTYDFYVLERSLGTGAGREWTISRQLSADVDSYTFVLADNHGEIQFIVIENPPSSTTQTQVAAVHAGVDLPAMDIYLAAPGTGIAGTAPYGTIAPLAQLPAANLPPGDYEIWLTAAGNPADVLFASPAISLTAGLATLIVTPEAGATTANFSVVVLQTFPTTVYDRSVIAQLRVINGATDAAPRDFAINREFSPPLFGNIPFATPTAYATVPIAIDQPINVTPVGNPGVLELDQLFATFPTQRWTLLFAGDAGTLTHTLALDDNRSIHGEAKIQFLDVATQVLYLSFVVVPPGADNPNLFPAVAALTSPGISDYVPLPPGDWDLYLYSSVTGERVGGPTRVSLAAGGVYSAMAVNGADTSTAAFVLLDGFN
jgi:hypothetical protein